MFGSWLVLLTAFTFAEALILPPLAPEAPQVVDSFLGIFSGSGAEVSLGVFGITGPSFSRALHPKRPSIRRRHLPCPDPFPLGAGVLILGMALTPLASIFPHTAGSVFAVPVGLAMMWLGYSLWSEERKSAGHQLVQGSHEPAPTPAN